MANKPINKDYLTSTLKTFDEEVLNEKYDTVHANREILDKFIESEDGELLFNGEKIQGEKGEEGRSVTKIEMDENNNVLVTFSDNTTENIGQLDVDFQEDFLVEEGFGKLRFYNNKFQYYDEASSAWTDIEATTDNPLVMNLAPQAMQKMHLTYDIDVDAYKITFKEPKDTIVDGQMLVCVEGVKFVRKLGSEPTDENDGTLVLDYKRRDFSNYNHTFYLDKDLDATNGEHWYYKAFPYSTNGIVANSSANVASCVCKDYYLYGFKLDQNESDPASMITYLEDCDNAYYESAYMDYDVDIFRYGDWEEAWFIRDLKPVMLKYDGTVDYELNKYNYTQKTDNTASDIANTSYEGNAMIGFPRVYWKIVDNGDNAANIYFCNKKIDDDFVCWSHIDNNGNEIDYCYMPIYNGYYDGTRLRSLSGKTPIYSQTPTVEFNYAKANNLTSDTIWNVGLFSDRQLINLLLLLIGKSTDTQTIFGNGYCATDVTETNNPRINTGTMDSQGLFWGSNTMTSGVKVFGMENYWGNQWQRIAGYINAKGVQKIKLTYGQSDGSTVNGYNIDGSGYIEFSEYDTSNIQTAQYISEMYPFSFGLLPKLTSGSSTTYFTDSAFIDRNYSCVLMVGCRAGYGYHAGALCTNVSLASTITNWGVGASISCKPLATTT